MITAMLAIALLFYVAVAPGVVVGGVEHDDGDDDADVDPDGTEDDGAESEDGIGCVSSKHSFFRCQGPLHGRPVASENAAGGRDAR